MAQKYIVGDWVKFLSEESKIIEVYDGGSYFMGSPNITGCSKEEELSPIPLTTEILEKNGWKKEVMSRGIKNSHWVYTKPDIEEYGYFPIYIEKGIGDEFDVYPFTGNHICTQIAYIKYVHQLQHLLFGLGIKNEMEV